MVNNKSWLGSEMDIRKEKLHAMSAAEWKTYIEDNTLSPEDLARLFYMLPTEELLIDIERVPELTKVFLEHGMDPNGLTRDDESADPGGYYYDRALIACLQYWKGGPEVEAMMILLEHGADPNIKYDIISDEYYMTVFDFFDDCPYINGKQMGPGEFYGLLLCSAYGGICRDGVPSFEMLTNDPITIFKDYNKYWFKYDGKMYVVEKESGKKIAEYRW